MPPVTAAPTTPAGPQVGAGGRIAGIDGVLDQIAGAISRQLTPIIQNTVLPILQRDKELQKTIGEAAGRGAVKALRPFLFVTAGALVFIAWTYYRSKQPAARNNPPRLRSARR